MRIQVKVAFTGSNAGPGESLWYPEWASAAQMPPPFELGGFAGPFDWGQSGPHGNGWLVAGQQAFAPSVQSEGIKAGAGYAGVWSYRTIDGTGNNISNNQWGSTDEQLLRLMPAAYADGYSAPSGDDRPNPRSISQIVADQAESVPNEAGASDFLWAWGQFVDHDIDLTPIGNTEYWPIAVPEGDPYFDPYGTGTQTIHFLRSEYDPDTGDDVPRQQINKITAFIDASNVYGSDAVRAEFLRADGGKLKVSDGNLLPYNDGSLPNDGPGGDDAFVAGDVRANENVALTSMHTLFVREHNRLVDELKQQHPDWDDDTLYQEAKALVEAKIQAITYNEFLPLLLGEDALPDYTGYDPTIDPGISNVFATAAYRVGHTMLSANILRLQENGDASEEGHLALREAFFNPDLLVDEGGIEPILRGLAAGQAEEIDALVVDDVRNFLFGPPGSGGLDLVSLNIQRGRDHGLPSYNEAREAFGLDPAEDFSDITSLGWLQQRLAEAYDSVDQIDIFIGGLAEDHVEGAMVGELIREILIDQFARLRDGDRFWYENRFEGDTLDDLKDTTLAEILLDNTGIEHIQHEAFLVSSRLGGSDGPDWLFGDGGRNLIFGDDGNDKILGRGDDDDLFGDAGNDHLFGGPGADWLWGGDDHDFLFGGPGDDRLYGGEGRDHLRGGVGDDWLLGGGDIDHLWGGPGDDWFTGGPGDDLIFLGEGADTVVFEKDYGAGERAGEQDIVLDMHEDDSLDFGEFLSVALEMSAEASAGMVDQPGEWHYAEQGGVVSVFSEVAAGAVNVQIGGEHDITAEQMKLVIV